MLHLKKLISDNKDIKDDIVLNNINEILKTLRNDGGIFNILQKRSNYNYLIKEKYIFSDNSIRDSYFLKIIENCDFNEYIIESRDFIGTFINSEDLKINTESDYLFLYNEEINLMIPISKVKNNKEEFYKIYINDVIYVPEYMIEKCDGCSASSLKDLLFNLYPEINTGLDKKYEDFKGNVCSDCLERMEKGIILKNEEKLKEQQSACSNVDEKIDEFSSIEDILKFCGMDDKKELQKALENKIYNSNN